MPPETNIFLNGMNGETGKYLFTPTTSKQLLPFITGESDTRNISWLKRMYHLSSTGYQLVNLDWTDYTEAGWGVIFHQAESAEVRKALEPLIQLRRSQVYNPRLLKLMEYHEGETALAFLGRYGIFPGIKNPEKVPNYLLVVGSPERIPYVFNRMLSLDYAVGRLYFDQAADYEAYAASVIAYVTSQEVPNAREAVFFGTRHQFDPVTVLSADQLVTPLVDGIRETNTNSAMSGIAEGMNFLSWKYLEAHATKAALTQVFAPPPGRKPPAFLFTASHGMGWPNGHKDQLAKQGALLCQDWPGFGEIAPEHYFSAADLPANARLHGLISFHFACYSASTPASDRFMHKPGKRPPAVAPAPFIAALPKALLSHPNGGALAVIGHVDHDWSYFITPTEAVSQFLPIRNAIGRILGGMPVGYAFKDFALRYAALSVVLADLMERKTFGERVLGDDLVGAWIERNNSESYEIIGDPAVRLRVTDLPYY